MNKIETILDYSAAQQGWNDQSKVILLLRFLEQEYQMNRLVAERFQDFLDEQVEQENSFTDEEGPA